MTLAYDANHTHNNAVILFAASSDFDEESVASINERQFLFLLRQFIPTDAWYVDRRRSFNSLLIAHLKILTKFLFDRRHGTIVCSGVLVGSLGIICRRHVILNLIDVPLASLERRGHLLIPRIGNHFLHYLVVLALDHFALKRAKGFIVAGTSAANLLASWGRVDRRRISNVPLYVNDAFFRVQRTQRREGVLKVGYAGSFHPHTLISEIIDAARICANRGIPLDLELVGDGPYLKDVKRQAQQVNNATISFRGWIPHSSIPEFLERIDVFLAPMSLEMVQSTLPTKILEAAAAGRVVITTDSGAVRSVFGNALLYIGNPIPESAATCIEMLYNNPKMRFELGERARSIAQRHFTLSVARESMHDFLTHSLQSSLIT